ncbi:MAG: glycosyltransferase family 9 protein [Casimicrobiaceae bacterium]
MANSRAPLRVLALALAGLRWGAGRRPVAKPRRILVLNQLLLGDTLMLTGLLAKLRNQHRDAEIVMTMAPAMVPLYARRPYGVAPVGLDPRDVGSVRPLLSPGGFDLAILPADNRWSWLARGVGARWIVGFAHDQPAYKNWPVDHAVAYSSIPTAFVDSVAELVEGPAPPRYDPVQWPAPDATDGPAIAGPYAVLHVGASSILKLWPAQRWRDLADWLRQQGLGIAWTAGRGEGAIIDAIAPPHGDRRFAGTLSLPGMWHVIAGARLLVCPDTGIAHLGRVVGVPTVVLYGPGSAVLCGAGAFFADMPFRAVTIDPFPCRNQRIQFFREVAWVRRCERLPGTAATQCARALCMEAIEPAMVTQAIVALGGIARPRP